REAQRTREYAEQGSSRAWLQTRCSPEARLCAATAESPIESSAPRPSRSRVQSFARCTVSVRKAGEHLEEQWAARGRSCSYRQRTRVFAKAGPCGGDATGAESTLDTPP